MTQQRTFVSKLQATNKGCVELEVRVTWRYRRGHWRRQCYDARQCYHLFSDDCPLICIRSEHWMKWKTFAWKTTQLQKWNSRQCKAQRRGFAQGVGCSNVSCNANWTSIIIESKCSLEEEKLNIQRRRTKGEFFCLHVNTHQLRKDSIQVPSFNCSTSETYVKVFIAPIASA